MTDKFTYLFPSSISGGQTTTLTPRRVNTM